MSYIYDLTDTWNASGTVFNGIKLNVTNTASAAASKLVTLQIGGTEHFSVTKAGVGYFSGNVGIGTGSPAAKLDVVGAGVFKLDGSGSTTPLILRNNNTASTQLVKLGFDSNGAIKASINAAVYGNDYMTFNVGSDTERMRIDSSGNVGIGTSSAGAKLTVIGSGSKLYVDLSGDNYYDAANHVFRNFAGSERARIDSSGNLLVNRSSSSGLGKLNCEGGADFTGGNVYLVRDTGNLLVGTTSNTYGSRCVFASNGGSNIMETRQTGTGNQYHAIFINANGGVGSITTDGSATQFVTSSDVRLKDNITDADDAASLIDALQVRKFDWKADGNHQRYGFVAQELVTVAPEAVSQPADPDEMMGVDYSKLVPMLVKEIQSLRARVAQLEGN